MPKILLLTGPGGAGKSTIAEMLALKKGFVYLDGDREDTEFFPDGDQWESRNRHLLKKAHEKILTKAKQFYSTGKNVIVDYIIFGDYENFVTMFQKTFGRDFDLIILFPSQEVLIKRDEDRECWTTGPERIAAVYQEFETLRGFIGAEKYLDTSEQSPEETMSSIVSLLDTNS